MTADVEAPPVGEDSRMRVVAGTLEDLWADLDSAPSILWADLDSAPSIAAEAAAVLAALDRHDTDTGTVRVNLSKQRAIEAERDRLRGVVHAMLQAFKLQGETTVDGQSGGAYVRSIWVPESMFEGWRLAAEGGS